MLKRTLPIVSVLLFAIQAFGQSGGVNAPPPPPPGADGMQDGRQGVLRELGLSRDQLGQIRGIRQRQRDAMEAAQEKLRAANRDLDEAIYADDATEETINKRLSEVQAAQSEVLRARSMTEFQIRRVLTPDQLRSFRDARRRFGEGRQPGPSGPGVQRGPGRDGQNGGGQDRRPPRDNRPPRNRP